MNSTNVVFPQNPLRVLVIDWMVPTYDQDAGSLRMYSLLKILVSLNYAVTFFPNDNELKEPYTSELREKGIEVLNNNINMQNYLKTRGGDFSIVILSRPDVAYKYLPMVRAYAVNCKVVYDTVDIHWVRNERAAKLYGNQELQKRAEFYRTIETLNALGSDLTLTVTENDKQFLLENYPELKIEVIPTIHEVVKPIIPFDKRHDLLFIGGFNHQPNVDAVLYFAKQIFPLVKKKFPGIKFFVLGSNPPATVRKLNDEGIKLTGFVKDVQPYFTSCRLFVAPLRYGAGIKGKIGHSMAYGLPAVTTSIGAEGMGLIDRENALIADQPRDFADAVIDLYTNEALWHNISTQSIKHIEKNYSPEVISRKVKTILSSLSNLEKV